MQEESIYKVNNVSFTFEKLKYGENSVTNWKPDNKNKLAGELYVNASSNRANHCILVSSRFNKNNSDTYAGRFPGWFLQIVGNQFSFAFGDGSKWISVKSKPVENDKWYHVAFSLDNEKKKAAIYLNGEMNMIENIQFKIPCDTLVIGSLMPNGSFKFLGEIENLKLGDSIIKREKIVKLNINKSLSFLSEIRINLLNINNDICSLQDILNQLHSWKLRGLEIDSTLLEKQIKYMQTEQDIFIKDMETEYNNLKNLDNEIRKKENSSLIEGDIIELYEHTLKNILEDVKLLESAFNDLLNLKKKGIKLGSAFETIEQQKELIFNEIKKSESKLKNWCENTEKIMNIVTILN